jgi:VanZ family protein
MPFQALLSTRTFKWAAWTLLVIIVLATLSPIEMRPTLHVPANRERFMAFAALGGAFWMAYPRNRLVVVVLLLGGAAALELFQHLTPDRHGVVRDAAIKVLGAALGCIGGAVADWFLPTKAMRR